MNKNEAQIKKMLAILLVLCSIFVSCSKEEEKVSNIFVDNIEGKYLGVFVEDSHQDKQYEGNITIAKMPNGSYTLEMICDGLNIHAKAEGVEEFGSNATNLRNDYGDEFPIWWHVYGGFQSDGLYLLISKRIYGNPNVEGAGSYRFKYGKK